MVKYIETNVTAKSGINHVKSIVKQAGCNFVQILLENDLGIDAIIELIDNGKPRTIAIQVKSGNSFYVPQTVSCKISVSSHYEYWNEFEIPVIGIVYIPLFHKAFWIDIKSCFQKNGEINNVSFDCKLENEFTLSSFVHNILNKFKNKSDLNELINVFFYDDLNGVFLTFLNTINPVFKNNIKHILLSNSLIEFVESIGWKIISIEEYEYEVSIRRHIFYATGTSIGSFYWSKDIHVLAIDSAFLMFANERFLKLKEIVNGNAGLIP